MSADLTEAEKAIRADWVVSLQEPFGPFREDQSWNEAAWEDALAAFRSRQDAAELAAFEEKFKVDWQAIRERYKAGIPEYMKPGWVSPLTGQPIGNLATLLEDPSTLQFIKGSASGWCDAKVLIIEFWATWCKPCHKLFPHLSELAEAHPEPALKILGINVEDVFDRPGAPPPDTDKVEPFVTTRDDMRYPVAIDVAHKLRDDVFKLVGYPGIPSAVVITPADSIVHYAGTASENHMDETVSKLLADGCSS